jgi:hypothetical protein
MSALTRTWCRIPEDGVLHPYTSVFKIVSGTAEVPYLGRVFMEGFRNGCLKRQ